ncbi:hypothetical protein MATR_24760 [Marivirga tractuosa]|uniref:Uncharacterized protein n=1 Tax=Marivirga tractuosa (strain ATCC 23168 / DSM 4126 / NBRC 15989 / NCIMB 1408 / VKM B-1430 / H-43) TaxID=643867 RepID=E4TQH5_MARTH|nr:hypothetical protein [Marivirga tractuosa]ADR23668.1 hypothetical protein Ftrac_3701 [Marivirga tractuosa DSM 4126]BDD15651.1 hypothetical protein MATR_24760 [Marivirga tractuosa]
MKKILLFVISFLFINLNDILAQCAMCRATVENNVNNGEIGIASSLNFGILYLFAAPYLVAMVIGILWYRNSKKQGKKIDVKAILSRNKY